MKKAAYTFIISLILFTPVAKAWNAAGHHIVGAIAYYTLQKKDRAKLAKTVSILKHHPWYTDAAQWPEKLKGVGPEQKDIVLFMLASTWPDDIKSGKTNFEMHKNWHYVDNAYVKPGSTVEGKPVPTPNSYDAYSWATTVLQSTASDSEKAIAISWMLHVIGDIHQPLHSTEMYADTFPKGDMGGNILCVTAEGKVTNLHAFWDDLFGKSALPFDACTKIAHTLIDSFPENSLSELKQNTTIQDWIIKESYPIAIKSVYINGALEFDVKAGNEKGCDTGPLLCQSYIDKAHTIAKKQVVLAGIRLRDYIFSTLY